MSTHSASAPSDVAILPCVVPGFAAAYAMANNCDISWNPAVLQREYTETDNTTDCTVVVDNIVICSHLYVISRIALRADATVNGKLHYNKDDRIIVQLRHNC